MHTATALDVISYFKGHQQKVLSDFQSMYKSYLFSYVKKVIHKLKIVKPTKKKEFILQFKIFSFDLIRSQELIEF